MKRVKTLMLISLLTASFYSSAGIPVAIDASQEWAVEAARWTERLKQWSETAQHYQSQIQAYKDQLATATGIRNIAAFTNELSNLQSELTNIYKQGNSYISDFTSNPEGALSSQAKNLFSKYGAFDMCNTGYERNDNLCKARIVSTAASIEQGNEINKQLSSAMSQIQSLSSRIEASKDIKESQDLANALQAQSLKMQAIKMQYDVWNNKNKADHEMLVTQEQEAFIKQQKEAEPLTFD
ncbi:type IV secretion system protein VirB5 [Escherichia coli]|nr:type IV secretion system protein VirB5 [Escherichia coli]HDY2287454.1 type IV secretion system protein VirB5 [Escherichia coli]